MSQTLPGNPVAVSTTVSNPGLVSYVFSAADFTTSDPANIDPSIKISLVSPADGKLTWNGQPVSADATYLFKDIGSLQFKWNLSVEASASLATSFAFSFVDTQGGQIGGGTLGIKYGNTNGAFGDLYIAWNPNYGVSYESPPRFEGDNPEGEVRKDKLLIAPAFFDPDGINGQPAITYRWFRASDAGHIGQPVTIDGITGNSYAPGADDVGSLIGVTAVYTDAAGFENTVVPLWTTVPVSVEPTLPQLTWSDSTIRLEKSATSVPLFSGTVSIVDADRLGASPSYEGVKITFQVPRTDVSIEFPESPGGVSKGWVEAGGQKAFMMHIDGALTKAEVEAALKGVKFATDAPHLPATVDVTITATDAGGNGVESDPQVITVELPGRNAEPVGEPSSYSPEAGTDAPLPLAAFRFSDADSDSLRGIVITSLPDTGLLKFDGLPIAENTMVTWDQFSENRLSFNSAGAAHLKDQTTFKFKVVDAFGGVSADAADMTLEFNFPAYLKGPIMSLGTVSSDPALDTTFMQGTALEAPILIDGNGFQLTPSGQPDVHYSWQRITGNKPATEVSQATSYTPVQADVGSRIALVLSYIDKDGNSESIATDETPEIRNLPEPVTGTVQIAGGGKIGDAIQAQTLLSDPDGTASMTYTWLRNGKVIADHPDKPLDPKKPAYLLTAEDQGSLITVQVKHTDSFGDVTTVVSQNSVTGNYIPTINAGPLLASGAQYQFQPADFGFGDLDAGDTIKQVTLTGFSGSGSLMQNGSTITPTEGAPVTLYVSANAMGTGLYYLPKAGTYGENQASLSYKVSDGKNFSPAGTMAINVAEPSNRAPELHPGLGVLTPVGSGMDLASTVLPLADGRIMVAGTASNAGFAVLRYTSGGALDKSFGDGLASSGHSGISLAVRGDAQADKYVGIGLAEDGAGGSMQSAGALVDGSRGFVTIGRDPSGAVLPLSASGSGGLAFSLPGAGFEPIAALPREGGGQFILAHAVTNAQPVSMLVAVDAHGVPDPGFGAKGISSIKGFWAAAFTRDADGGFVLTGQDTILQTPSLARVDGKGLLDADMGVATMQKNALWANGQATAVASIGSGQDERILAAGTATVAGVNILQVSRYAGDGKYDDAFFSGAMFNRQGLRLTETFRLGDMLTQPDGKIVLAAESSYHDEASLVLQRYLPNGTFDFSFGDHGQVYFAMGKGALHVGDLALQASDGKYLVTGGMEGTDAMDMFVLRIMPDGAIDPGFHSTLQLTPGGPAAILDGAVYLADQDLDAKSYAGSSLSLVLAGIRSGDGPGDANAEPVGTDSSGGTINAAVTIQEEKPAAGYFGFTDAVSLVGNELYVSGIHIGTLGGRTSATSMAISFNENATRDQVQTLMRHITYRVAEGGETGAVTIRWIFNDGTSGDDGTAVFSQDIMVVAPAAPDSGGGTTDGGTAGGGTAGGTTDGSTTDGGAGNGGIPDGGTSDGYTTDVGPPIPPPTVINGVPVIEENGGIVIVQEVPSGTPAESGGIASQRYADIPLPVPDSAPEAARASAAELQAHLPTGVGMAADWVSADNYTPVTADLWSLSADGGKAHEDLRKLLDQVQDDLLHGLKSALRHLKFTNSSAANYATNPFTVEGKPKAGESTELSTAVIDTRQMSIPADLHLKNMDFVQLQGPAQVVVEQGSTTLYGDDAAQSVSMGEGNDLVYGGGGNDSIIGGSGQDIIDAGAGDDRVVDGIPDVGQWEFRVRPAAGSVLAQYQPLGHGDAKLISDQAHNFLTAQGAVAKTSIVATPGLFNTAVPTLGFLAASENPDRLADIALLYHVAFKRVPDLAGLGYWAGSDMSMEQIAASFVEFMDKVAGDAPLDDKAFVAQVAAQALGLTPQDPKVAQWLAELDPPEALPGQEAVVPRTRAQVLLEITLDPDHVAAMSTGDGILLGQETHTIEGSWFAHSGDDLLRGGAGDDTLAGGDGQDTALYDGVLKDFILKRTSSADGWMVQDRTGLEGKDQLNGIENLRFADKNVNLLVHDAARALGAGHAEDLKDVVALYIGFGGRLPDADGMAYWISTLADGASKAAVAGAFASIFERGLGDAAFVDLALANVRGVRGDQLDDSLRTPWLAQLENGISRGDMMLALIDDTQALPADDAMRMLLDKRVTIGGQLAVDYGIGYGSDAANAMQTRELMARVTHDSSATALQLVGLGPDSFQNLGAMVF